MGLECFFYQVEKNPKNPPLAQGDQGELCPFGINMNVTPEVAYFARGWWIVDFFQDRCEKYAEAHGIQLDYDYCDGCWFDRCLYRISLKDAEDFLDAMKNLPEDEKTEWASWGYDNMEELVNAEKLIKTMKEEPDYDYYFVAWW